MNESARSLTSRVSYLGDSGAAHNFILIIGLAGIAVCYRWEHGRSNALLGKRGILAEIDAKISVLQPHFPFRPVKGAQIPTCGSVWTFP